MMIAAGLLLIWETNDACLDTDKSATIYERRYVLAFTGYLSVISYSLYLLSSLTRPKLI